jgi:exosome complex RNA-binding protein Rrp4
VIPSLRYFKEANMAETKTTKATEEVTKEKKVKIRLPLTRTEKNDVLVGVNGRTWLIKRGEEVEVPECVAEVLQHKEEMLTEAMAFEEQAATKS